MTAQPTEDELDAAYEDELAWRREVSIELRRLRVREEARRRHERDAAAATLPVPFDAGTLDEILARPAGPPERTAGLVPTDASVLLVAQRKTGKTTAILNYARSLLTGAPFLGAFDVRPVTGRVALLNFEVGSAQVARWADEHGIPRDRLLIANLRGRRNPLAHPEDRARLAGLLRAHDAEAVIVDPFGRAYAGTSQNDSGEVGAWLVGLDQFVRTEVGATDLLLCAHAGWNGERTRGSSALEDWADVVITLTKDEETSDRYLRAIGRDVDVDEDRLDYDPATRTLSLSGVGSRAKAREDGKLARLAVLVVRASRESPGLSYAAAENAVRAMDDNPGFRKGEVARAARWASEKGQLHIGSGARGAAVLTPLDHLPHLPHTSPGGASSTSPTSPYRGEVEVGGPQPQHLPRERHEA